MKRLPNNYYDLLESNPTARTIWENVAYSMDSFTHDSFTSNFFQPEAIINECRSMAASFTVLHYAPIPDMKKIYRSRLYALFFLSLCCGVQIYIKERSILK